MNGGVLFFHYCLLMQPKMIVFRSIIIQFIIYINAETKKGWLETVVSEWTQKDKEYFPTEQT